MLSFILSSVAVLVVGAVGAFNVLDVPSAPTSNGIDP